eukprot:1195663-Prorocentrum_minimum.AAC.4
MADGCTPGLAPETIQREGAVPDPQWPPRVARLFSGKHASSSRRSSVLSRVCSLRTRRSAQTLTQPSTDARPDDVKPPRSLIQLCVALAA